MRHFNQYSIEKRKKIALWCTVGFALVLVAVLIFVYSRPQTRDKYGFDTMIVNGYTTILESAQSYFAQK